MVDEARHANGPGQPGPSSLGMDEAFERVAKWAYAGVGEKSGNFKRDYGGVTEDLAYLAYVLGFDWEPPDYVRDIIEGRWTSSQPH